jgi:hypothetical protein
LTFAKFDGAFLAFTSFNNSWLLYSEFLGADLRSAKFSNERFESVPYLFYREIGQFAWFPAPDFRCADLSKADFSGYVILMSTNVRMPLPPPPGERNLAVSNTAGENLRFLNIENAKVDGADFRSASVGFARFQAPDIHSKFYKGVERWGVQSLENVGGDGSHYLPASAVPDTIDLIAAGRNFKNALVPDWMRAKLDRKTRTTIYDSGCPATPRGPP